VSAEQADQAVEHSQEEEVEDKVESYRAPVQERGGYPPELQRGDERGQLSCARLMAVLAAL
jgi:hypothetical protein